MSTPPTDAASLQAITRSLSAVPVDGAIASLPNLLAPLRELLKAEVSCAYSVRVDDGRCHAEFIHGDGLSQHSLDEAARWFVEAPVPWGRFDPSRPDPEQVNRVVATSDLPGDPLRSPPPIAAQLFPRIGLAGKDQLRVLVCEGRSLLAWVGAFREEPFTTRERGLLAELVAPLQQRLSFERRIARSELSASTLDVALNALGAAAFLIGPRGRIIETNAAAERLRELNPDLRGQLSAALAGDNTEFTVTEVLSRGQPDHFLVIQRPKPPSVQHQSQLAAARWSLTRRQGEVLALLAEGLSNRAIAARLGCSESTVEIHVSAILSKADADSRAALAARVWSSR